MESDPGFLSESIDDCGCAQRAFIRGRPHPDVNRVGNDADGAFANPPACAYSYSTASCIIMTYDNNGYGIAKSCDAKRPVKSFLAL